MKHLFILFSLILQSTLAATQIHCISDNDTITQLQGYVSPKTLFVFEIDNTLMRSRTHLGTDQWYANEGTDSRALVMQHVEMVPVDESLLAFLDELNHKKIPCIIVTSRPESLKQDTLRQLKQLNIEQESLVFGDPSSQISRDIETVVCVDSCMEHIEACMEAAKQKGLSYFGLRFSKCDDLHYDHAVALKQYDVLVNGLTQEEREFLQHDPEGRKWLRDPQRKIPPNEIAEKL